MTGGCRVEKGERRLGEALLEVSAKGFVKFREGGERGGHQVKLLQFFQGLPPGELGGEFGAVGAKTQRGQVGDHASALHGTALEEAQLTALFLQPFGNAGHGHAKLLSIT